MRAHKGGGAGGSRWRQKQERSSDHQKFLKNFGRLALALYYTRDPAFWYFPESLSSVGVSAGSVERPNFNFSGGGLLEGGGSYGSSFTCIRVRLQQNDRNVGKERSGTELELSSSPGGDPDALKNEI